MAKLNLVKYLTLCASVLSLVSCGKKEKSISEVALETWRSNYSSIISKEKEQEMELTLKYVYIVSESLNNFYYKGSFGHWTTQERIDSTTFYNSYNLSTKYFSSSSKREWELAESLVGTEYCKGSGTLLAY